MLSRGYGEVACRVVNRANRWRRQLRAEQLPLGNAERTGEQRRNKFARHTFWDDKDGSDVGGRDRRQGKHIAIPPAARHTGRAGAAEENRSHIKPSGRTATPGMPDLRKDFHPSDISIGSRRWALLLPCVPRKGAEKVNGIHGQKRIWSALRLDELAVLNQTIQAITET